MTYIRAYTGYDPPPDPNYPGCASSAIDLTQVPIPPPDAPGVNLCTFVLAFANDINGDGMFQPQWDTTHFTPEYLAEVTAANPAVNFAASLGGGIFPWRSIPGDAQPWINNAVSSITDIGQTYGLVSVDVDYEDGLDDTFVPVMSSVILQSGLPWSVAPFTGTLDTYLNLYDAVAQQNPGARPNINFQAYAMETEDPQAYIQQYTDIRNDPRVASHGYAIVGLGIDTNTTSPRGMQYPAITEFCFSHGPGTPNDLFDFAVIWSIEDSCKNGYPVERSLAFSSGQSP